MTNDLALAQPEVEEEEKEESFLRFLLGLVLYTFFTLGALAVIAGVLGSALGYYRIETVLTGSMRPDYPPGSVIVAFEKDKEKIQTGDVIVFRSPDTYGGEVVTHRVISARLTDTGDVYVRTKGDANPAPDPWEALVTTTKVWEVRQSIPYVGYVAYYAKQWWPLLLALAVTIPMMSYANARVREAFGWKKGKPRHAS